LDQSAAVRTESWVSNELEIKQGVRYGCVLSPRLLNLYTEKIFREVEDFNGATINGININNLRYADDTALLCFCPNDLQRLLDACNEAGKHNGMDMNIKKAKIMVVSKSSPSPRINITLEGSPIKQTNYIIRFTHYRREVKIRIEVARSAVIKMNKILTSRKISIDARKKLCVCYVWSKLLYGSET